MKRIFLLTAGIYVTFIVFFLLIFRVIRSLFLPPEISSYKIVGYSQYYGYPFYYDTLAFFVLILFPSIIFLILCLVRKK